MIAYSIFVYLNFTIHIPLARSKNTGVSDKLMHLYILDGNTMWHRMF